MLAALPRPCSMIAWRWRQMFEMSSIPSLLRTSACALSRVASAQ
jgi:hypothetical protein